MDVESKLQTFSEWFWPSTNTNGVLVPGALLEFVIWIAVVALLSLAISFIVATVKHGPARGICRSRPSGCACLRRSTIRHRPG